jgi:hypothetical protein
LFFPKIFGVFQNPDYSPRLLKLQRTKIGFLLQEKQTQMYVSRLFDSLVLAEMTNLQRGFVEERRFSIDHFDAHDAEGPNVHLGSVRQPGEGEAIT